MGTNKRCRFRIEMQLKGHPSLPPLIPYPYPTPTLPLPLPYPYPSPTAQAVPCPARMTPPSPLTTMYDGPISYGPSCCTAAPMSLTQTHSHGSILLSLFYPRRNTCLIATNPDYYYGNGISCGCSRCSFMTCCERRKKERVKWSHTWHHQHWNFC